MEKVLVDSCIFIDIFRGNHDLYLDLMRLDAAINSIVYMELIQGARDKQELSMIEKFLRRFELLSIDEDISRKSVTLMKTYSLSHGLLIPDALIAATAIIKRISLWSFNKRDFGFIEKLTLFPH